jgi:hypothetical protein
VDFSLREGNDIATNDFSTLRAAAHASIREHNSSYAALC